MNKVPVTDEEWDEHLLILAQPPDSWDPDWQLDPSSLSPPPMSQRATQSQSHKRGELIFTESPPHKRFHIPPEHFEHPDPSLSFNVSSASGSDSAQTPKTQIMRTPPKPPPQPPPQPPGKKTKTDSTFLKRLFEDKTGYAWDSD